MMPAHLWRVVGASVQGTSHLEKSVPCQDVHAYRILAGGELLVAVADGAGSAERSLEGATLAVEQALARLETILGEGAPIDEAGWQAILLKLFDDTRQKLADYADTAATPLRSFATTMTCIIATDAWLVVGQIGDGAAVFEDSQGEFILTVRPQRGEYANEAYFLTLPDPTRYVTVYASQQPIRALAVTTDGLLRLALKLPEYTPFPKFFQPLLDFVRETTDEAQAAQELTAFLGSERVYARTDDDKTLVLAVRMDSPAAAGSAG